MSYKLLINYQLLINTRQYVRLGGNVLFHTGLKAVSLSGAHVRFFLEQIVSISVLCFVRIYYVDAISGLHIKKLVRA